MKGKGKGGKCIKKIDSVLFYEYQIIDLVKSKEEDREKMETGIYTLSFKIKTWGGYIYALIKLIEI